MISLVVTLIIVGLLVYAEERYLPIHAEFKKIIRWVVIVCVVAWLLYAFGVLPWHKDIPVPQLHG